MIHYNCAGDLEQFGFRCLTGEACGLGMRLLYDLNEEAREVLARTLGLGKDNLTLLPSWNGGEFDAGSAMLTNEMALTCAIFAMLFKKGCVEVWQKYENGRLTGELYGMESGEELELYLHAQQSARESFRRWKRAGTGMSGDRNVHVMSGRES